MRARSAQIARLASSAGSVARTSRAAATAKTSETGLALTFQIASSACDSASSALCRVTPRGSVSISCGSTSAASGQVSRRCSECFLPAARSQIVAHGVTSLPVPAVVGTAISALTRCGVKAAPVVSCAISSSKRPLAVPTISALAVSMALPPPTATTAGQSAWSCQKRSYIGARERHRDWARCGLRCRRARGRGCRAAAPQAERLGFGKGDEDAAAAGEHVPAVRR